MTRAIIVVALVPIIALIVWLSLSSAGVLQSRAVQTPDEILLFRPTQYPDGYWNPQGLVYEDVWLNSADGTQLHAWYCPVAEPVAVVLYLHGNGGNLSHRADVMTHLQTQIGVTTLILDYRGYGRSDGTPTVLGVMEDVRVARAVLAEKAGVPESSVVLMGRSLGGALASALAAEASPRGLVLESTFSSLRDIAGLHYTALSSLVPKSKLNTVATIGEYDGPLLLSHGLHDDLIPYEMGVRIFAAAHSPKFFVTIPQGGHNAAQTMAYYEELAKFLAGLAPNR